MRTLLERGGLLTKTVRPAEVIGKLKQEEARKKAAAEAKAAAKAEAEAAAAEEAPAEEAPAEA